MNKQCNEVFKTEFWCAILFVISFFLPCSIRGSSNLSECLCLLVLHHQQVWKILSQNNKMRNPVVRISSNDGLQIIGVVLESAATPPLAAPGDPAASQAIPTLLP